MLGLVSFKSFSNQVSNSVALKGKLTVITFIGVCLPAAILMTAGYSERYVLSGLLGVIIPFQYLAFCLLNAAHRNSKSLSSRESVESAARPLSAGGLQDTLLCVLNQGAEAARTAEALPPLSVGVYLVDWLSKRPLSQYTKTVEGSLGDIVFLENWARKEIQPSGLQNILLRMLNQSAQVARIAEALPPVSVGTILVDWSTNQLLPEHTKTGECIDLGQYKPELFAVELKEKSALEAVIRLQRAPFESREQFPS